MRLSTFTDRTNTVKIDIMNESGDEKIDEIDVTYRPATWTPEFEDRMRPQPGQEWTTETFARALSEAVVRWTLTEDITGPDGTVAATEVPHTAERLRSVPTSLLTQIVTGISQDLSPKAPRSGS
ncbi:MAG: hypothetical protein LC772_06540 [Chloroflexi bacterium]|nr:hypothetical protein [Chloroflexota bacterium]